jgi:hypothetical protein
MMQALYTCMCSLHVLIHSKVACKWHGLLACQVHIALPLQDQGGCEACVGFAVTAAAEAAINVHLGQSWNKLNLSEQDLSFSRCGQNCRVKIHRYGLV